MRPPGKDACERWDERSTILAAPALSALGDPTGVRTVYLRSLGRAAHRRHMVLQTMVDRHVRRTDSFGCAADLTW